MVYLCCFIGDRSSKIDIREVASKTAMITKFKVEKFDGKSNFLLWKIRVTSLLVKKGTQGLLSIEKKPSKMEDDEWNDIDFYAKVTIIMCKSDESSTAR